MVFLSIPRIDHYIRQIVYHISDLSLNLAAPPSTVLTETLRVGDINILALSTMERTCSNNAHTPIRQLLKAYLTR